MVGVFRQPVRIVDAQVAQERDERPAAELKQFLFRRRLREVNGDGNALVVAAAKKSDERTL